MTLLMSVLTSFWVFALGAGTPTLHPVVQDEAAQQAFRLGVEAARQESWTEARTAFERAYSLSPRPVVLINLAGAQARTGRLTEAAKNYHRILEDPTSPETASFRKAAAEILPALEARIPRIRLRPSGLSHTDVIRVDGETVAAEILVQGRILDPGEHTLVVEHKGVERARVLFALTERELRYITLPLPVLSQIQPQSAIVAAGGASTAETSVSTSGVSQPGRVWWASPWTWIAVGAVVVGASVTTFLLVDRPHDQTFSGNIPPGQISIR